MILAPTRTAAPVHRFVRWHCTKPFVMLAVWKNAVMDQVPKWQVMCKREKHGNSNTERQFGLDNREAVARS